MPENPLTKRIRRKSSNCILKYAVKAAKANFWKEPNQSIMHFAILESKNNTQLKNSLNVPYFQ